MWDIIFILITAVAVAVDSFIGGLTIGYSKAKSKFFFPVTCALVTMALCALSMLFAQTANILLSEAKFFGCILLMVAGIINIARKEDSQMQANFWQLAVALGVALDAVIGTFSLIVMGYVNYYIPLIFSIMHFLAPLLGIILSKKLKKIRHANIFAGVTLIVLATLKWFLD